MAVPGPIEHVEVELAGPLGAATPGEFLERAGGGGIDRLAVDLHPGADFPQPLERWLGDQPLARRADIEQVLAPFAGAVDQVADQHLGRLPVVVVALEAPRVIHRHARLPIAPLEPGGGDFLFGRFGVARVDAQPIVVNDAGAKPQQGDELIGEFFGHAARGVPPKNRKRVAGQEFGHLRHSDVADVHAHVARLGRVPMLAADAPAGIVPVLRLRVVEAEPEAVALASLRQRLEQILAVGGGLGDVPVAGL